MISKKWLYLTVISGSLAGMVWVWWNMAYNLPADGQSHIGCMFRYVTGVPCPSCGSTRSVIDIFRLRFGAAFYDNPIGFLLAAIMIAFPIWVLYDLVKNESTFYQFYNRVGDTLKKRWVAVPLIIIILINWGWNIYKFYS